MKSAILTYSMCLAQVTLLPTALTKLTGTNCLEVSAGSAGKMSLPLIGGTLAIKVCERKFLRQDAEEEVDTDGYQGFGPQGWRSRRRREVDTDGH